MEPVTMNVPDAMRMGYALSKAPPAKEPDPRQKAETELTAEPGKEEKPEPKEAAVTEKGGMATEQLVDKLTREMSLLVRETDLEFELHESENRVVIRVYEKESGKLLREIPPSEAVELSKGSLDGKGRLLSKAI